MFDADVWQHRSDGDEFERERTADAEPADVSANSGGPSESGRLDDEPDYFVHLRQAFENGMPVDKHHVFPQAFLAEIIKANHKTAEIRDSDDREINIHEHTVPLPREWHKELNHSWHLEWTWFFEHHQDPTRAQIREQAAIMMEDYGFLEACFVSYWAPMYEAAPTPVPDLPGKK